ncbi:transcription-repair coupling factor, partial [Candidatus Margulisiibacteriota bacterium]
GVYFDGIEYYSNILHKEFTSLIHYLPESSFIFFDDRLRIENSLNKLTKESDEIKMSEMFIGRKLEITLGHYLTLPKIEKLFGGRVILEKGINEKLDLGFKEPKSFYGKLDDLSDWVKQSYKSRSLFVVSKQAGRLSEILSDNGIDSHKVEAVPTDPKAGVYVLFGEVSAGFSYSDITVLSDKEIFTELKPREKYLSKPKEGVSSKLLSELNIGDYVVHVNHGVGVFKGLETLQIDDATQEYISIEYLQEDKLYVPLHLMGMVQKYSSLGEYKPKINRLGGSEWGKTKTKAKKSIKDLTNELVDIYSARKQLKGFNFPSDTQWQAELEQSFVYEETPDQEKTVREVKGDMQSSRPMDRLICGDVGYGKTEVAIRAAFKAAASGKQVAVLVPTTVLAEQHFRNFSKRFESFPLVVEMLSRFRSKAEQQSIIKSLAAGAVDVVIGTHRLLQDDIKFKDLGLLIVDEEQRFGVMHKEKIKKIKKTVDVLTLTATPIPRTLYMSLSGARDMSRISTPPLDRSPIRTYLYEWNEAVIREAILRELERGGQIYFVHNFVRDIGKVADVVKRLVPTARVVVAHGQMKEKGLESVMIDFLNRKYDVLVCSTIIESGIDIPSVNTIIIDHAERFGLSQLYQLRGRVGRSSVRAYAYLMYHKEQVLSDSALERLKAIQEFTALGSGYKLAMRDLEIRGAGNVLGPEQHGHILSIGFDLYCDLLEESVKEIKKVPQEEGERTYIDLKINAFIPQDYVSDEKQRIALYRRMNFISSFDELNELRKELRDRFGKIPLEFESLIEIIVLKLKASKKKIASIEGGPAMVKIAFRGPYDQAKINKLKYSMTVYNKGIKLNTAHLPADKWFSAVKEIVEIL